MRLPRFAIPLSIILSLAFVLVVPLISCMGRSDVAGKKGKAPAGAVQTAPPRSTEAAVPNVPVEYDTRLNPERLTPKQICEILACASVLAKQPPLKKFPPKEGLRHTDDQQPKDIDEPCIWYIHVRDNYGSKDHLSYNVTIYFKPLITKPRVRMGLALHLDSRLHAQYVRGTWPRKSPLDGGDVAAADNPFYEYWQVSLKNRPFDAAIEVPPSILWPFPMPDGFTENEVVDIVDFVRTGPAVSHENEDGGYFFGGEFRSTQPILGMGRKEDGTISVSAGSVQGPLAGSGQEIILRKKGNTFTVVEIWDWVS